MLFLLSKIAVDNEYTRKYRTKSLANKVLINERFRACSFLFFELDKEEIPYAVIKGAVLSESAYGDPYIRWSSDVDLLINRKNADRVKKLLTGSGFLQGRLINNNIVPFTREEQIFQSSTSHQIAPFIKSTNIE